MFYTAPQFWGNWGLYNLCILSSPVTRGSHRINLLQSTLQRNRGFHNNCKSKWSNLLNCKGGIWMKSVCQGLTWVQILPKKKSQFKQLLGNHRPTPPSTFWLCLCMQRVSTNTGNDANGFLKGNASHFSRIPHFIDWLLESFQWLGSSI